MGKGKQRTPTELIQVKTLLDNKTPLVDISNQLNIPRKSISSIKKRYIEIGTVNPSPRSGRPPKLTDRNKRYLKSVVKENRGDTAREITERFNEAIIRQISVSTIRRLMKQKGYKAYVTIPKPLLSWDHARRRVL